jgi:hypothetical protein
MGTTEKNTWRSQGKRRPKIVRIYEEVQCPKWPKRKPSQALRDMRADREKMVRMEEELCVEMRPRVRHWSD